MQSKDIIDVLESKEAVSFIRAHINDNVSKLSLRFSGNVNFNITVCLQLMSLYKKVQKKIPFFYDNLLALDQRSYEQCTSSEVAKYKSSFISGSSILDITGGLGIDSIFLANGFSDTTVVERNKELHDLACYNVKKLGFTTIHRVHGNGLDYLNDYYDWIYIDPDRRKESKRNVVLENLEPNILELIPKLRKACNFTYLKLSPLYDLSEVWRCFEDVKEIHIVAEKGEIKEVGVLLDFKNKWLNPSIILKEVTTNFLEVISRSNCDSKLLEYYDSDDTRNVLIPTALIAKSRSEKYFLRAINVKKHYAFNLYFSNEDEVKGFRSFRILERTTNLSVKRIKEILRVKGISQVNLVVKGLRDNPEIWHKKLKTRDGGCYYLFILKSKKSESYLCEFISS
ncbi:MAG: hypothetical protein COA58_08360 [Bacteroidetes bacterium]|nr:MAG: hypothetical protein COA58_08360 [Bacteroidota bacterium]